MITPLAIICVVVVTLAGLLTWYISKNYE